MSVRTRGAHRATATPRTAPGFRADIQGLRALAVGLVVLDHAHVPGFPGGYIGVDVFFVISGFLITGLLINDIERHHRVRFLHFYARRALRILPMATVVIVTTSIASVLLLGVLAARSTLIDGVWAVFFVANVHFAQTGTNYFASTGTSALQHYWSLAVEEQFYLVWPAFLGVITFAVSRFRREAVPRRAIALTLVVLIAGSLMLSISDTANNATGAYFSTIDRASVGARNRCADRGRVAIGEADPRVARCRLDLDRDRCRVGGGAVLHGCDADSGVAGAAAGAGHRRPAGRRSCRGPRWSPGIARTETITIRG